jgi:hypothetical protein
MRDRNKLRLMTRLASVQRVGKAAAEAALMAARAAEAQALAEREEAEGRSESARSDWAEHVSGSGFSPEFSGALAARAVERDLSAAQARGRAERSAETAARRLSDFQASEARSRSGEDEVRRMKRRVGARIEEGRLAEMADRVTFDWIRR